MGQLEYCSPFAFMSVQLLYDVLEPEHIMSCLLSVLHRVEPSATQWSVKYTKFSFNFSLSKGILCLLTISLMPENFEFMR